MDILNSGSFVPLDNREKIEQLIFTAKTLATEVSRAEGFQNNGQTNQQIGLEMWKGAEYMCRAHEEATIRNLFLSKFLEKLREIERQTPAQPKPLQTQIVNTPITISLTKPVPLPVQPPSTQVTANERPEDEYLGVVSHEAGIEAERPSYTDECVPEFEAEIAKMKDEAVMDELLSTPTGEVHEDEPKQTTLSKIPEPEEAVITDARKADVSEIKESDPTETFVGGGAEIDESKTTHSAVKIDSIVLAEKEPYNFDSCTVTAVIQLLPESGGMRKCVVSVRSHDFAPQITISEFRAGEIDEHANRSLTEGIGLYRTEFPVLAAEKIKKAKPATKKRTAKTNDKNTTAGSAAGETSAASIAIPPAAQNAEAAKDQQNLFAS